MSVHENLARLMVEKDVEDDQGTAEKRVRVWGRALKRSLTGKEKRARCLAMLEELAEAGIEVDENAAKVAVEKLNLRAPAEGYAWELARAFPFLREKLDLLRRFALAEEHAELTGGSSRSGAFGTILTPNLTQIGEETEVDEGLRHHRVAEPEPDDALLQLSEEMFEHIERNAMGAMKEYLRAWRLHKVDEVPVPEVAKQLSKKRNWVYVAMNRVKEHFPTVLYELTQNCAAPSHGSVPEDYEHIRRLWNAEDLPAMGQALRDMEAERSRCPHYLNWLGIWLEKVEGEEPALETYMQAHFCAKDDPTRGKISHNIGCVYAAMGDAAEARLAWETARKEVPYAPAPAVSLLVDACLHPPEICPEETQPLCIEKCLNDIMDIARSGRLNLKERTYVVNKLRSDNRLAAMRDNPKLWELALKICRVLLGGDPESPDDPDREPLSSPRPRAVAQTTLVVGVALLAILFGALFWGSFKASPNDRVGKAVAGAPSNDRMGMKLVNARNDRMGKAVAGAPSNDRMGMKLVNARNDRMGCGEGFTPILRA